MVQKRGGFTSNEWRKSFQDRDEVLDCAVYARAAAYSGHIGMGRMTLAQWEALQGLCQTKIARRENAPGKDAQAINSRHSAKAAARFCLKMSRRLR